jgi:hypothetical protein
MRLCMRGRRKMPRDRLLDDAVRMPLSTVGATLGRDVVSQAPPPPHRHCTSLPQEDRSPWERLLVATRSSKHRRRLAIANRSHNGRSSRHVCGEALAPRHSALPQRRPQALGSINGERSPPRPAPARSRPESWGRRWSRAYGTPCRQRWTSWCRAESCRSASWADDPPPAPS